jgi:acyl-coenzyme A thioesterase PaaI-like protein
MAGSLFVVENETFVPTEMSRGPWSPDSLHGGPVAALLARALCDLPTAGPMFPARFTLELLRPVALEAMRIETSVVRPGRKVQVLEAKLHRRPDVAPSSETLVARGTLQQIREAPLVLPADLPPVADPALGVPVPEELTPAAASFGSDVAFHSAAVEHRSPKDAFGSNGPALDWIRVVVDLLPGAPLRPFERVVAAADFGNGISGMLPVPTYVFVNPDLSVFLHRLPVDEWVGLDAVTRLGTQGTAIAESRLLDRTGSIGRAVQTLIIEGPTS